MPGGGGGRLEGGTVKIPGWEGMFNTVMVVEGRSKTMRRLSQRPLKVRAASTGSAKCGHRFELSSKL
jgi:hypothetical protein